MMEMQAIIQARQKGLKWLLEHLNADGSFKAREKSLSCYSKAPLTLMKSGNNEKAIQVLNWIKNNYLRKNGDIRTCDEYKIDPSKDSSERRRYLYHNGWTCVSAHMNGMFGLARVLGDFIIDYQSKKNGGFYSNKTGGDYQGLTDISSTSSACLTFLYRGKREELLIGADYLINAFDCQTNKNVFCLYMNEDGTPVENLPKQRVDHYIVNSEKGKQNFWMLGISAALLVQVFNLTGHPKYLDYAKKYMEFLFASHQDAFTFWGSWKQGWACALLYQETGETKYKDAAIKVINYIIGYQDDDGAWRFGKDLGIPEEKDAIVFDLTSEMILWLFDLPRYLI